jgi:tetratricopeptide (TPR) repeat protein
VITEFNEKMPNSILRLLIKAEKLFDTGRYKEAFNLIDDFEQQENITLYNIIKVHLFKAELLFQQGKYKKVLLIAEATYQESLKLGRNPFSIESLAWMARALIFLNQLNKAYDLITKGENLLDEIPQKSTFEFQKSKAFISFIKGYFHHVKGDGEKSLE